jgi:hypothetical protein
MGEAAGGGDRRRDPPPTHLAEDQHERAREQVRRTWTPIARSVLANLESGRREQVSVAELLVLARALNVPPIQLIFRVGRVERSEPLPDRVFDSWTAAKWFTGEGPLPSEDEREPRDADWDGWQGTATPLRLYRFHDSYLEQRRAKVDELARHRAETVQDNDGLDRDAQARHVLQVEAELRSLDEVIRTLRDQMRYSGVTPPKLPTELSELETARRSRGG